MKMRKPKNCLTLHQESVFLAWLLEKSRSNARPVITNMGSVFIAFLLLASHRKVFPLYRRDIINYKASIAKSYAGLKSA